GICSDADGIEQVEWAVRAERTERPLRADDHCRLVVLYGQIQEIRRLLERIGPVRENDTGNLRILQASVNPQTEIFKLLRLVERKKLVRLHSHTSKLLNLRYPGDQFFPGRAKRMTDVDVLALRPHPVLYFERVLADCRTL